MITPRMSTLGALGLVALVLCIACGPILPRNFEGSDWRLPPGSVTPTPPAQQTPTAYPEWPERGALTVATFNLHFFYDTRDPQPVAEAIHAAGADVVAAQEVMSDGAARNLAVALGAPGEPWEHATSECGGSGGLHLAVFANPARAHILDAEDVREINETPGSPCDRGVRPGFHVWLDSARPGGVDFELLVLHLKATRGDDDGRPRRDIEWGRAVTWFAEQEQVEDLIILGDFNAVDGPLEWNAIVDRFDGQYLVPPGDACSYYYYYAPNLIDGMLVPAQFEELPAWSRMRPGGVCGEFACRTARSDAAMRERIEEYRDEVSDHCPLVLPLVDRDLDP
jgi:endonuclease/exonuclease/phosphatase family metal-dependent hydrolase